MPLNPDEISELYRDHARAVLAFLARRTWEPEVAVDLMAETFAQAFEDRAQFRGDDPGAARAWIFGIARNKLTDHFRRGVVERRALDRLGFERRSLSDHEYERIEELAGIGELRAVLGAEAGSLSTEQQHALWLRVVEEQPYGEIARRTGTTETTARARVSRALRALRDAGALNDMKEAIDRA